MSIIEITDLEIPELEVYIDKKEVQLLHYYEPEPGIFIAESPNVILRALEAGYEPLSLLMEKKPLDEKERAILDRCGEIPVYTASLEVLTRITGYQLARGMLCAMRRKALPSLKEICEGKRRIAILENVVNPTNVGAIFRSAAALSMDAVLLTKGSSDPLYRRQYASAWDAFFRFHGRSWMPGTGRNGSCRSCGAWDTAQRRWRLRRTVCLYGMNGLRRKRSLRLFLEPRAMVLQEERLQIAIIRS